MRKRSWHILMYYTRIYSDRQRKSAKSPQDSEYGGQDLNRGPPKYEAKCSSLYRNVR